MGRPFLIIGLGLILAAAAQLSAAETQILVGGAGDQVGDQLVRATVADLAVPKQPNAAWALLLATKARQAVAGKTVQTAAELLWWTWRQKAAFAKVRLERQGQTWQDREVIFSRDRAGGRSEWIGDRAGFGSRRVWDADDNQTVEEQLNPNTGAVLERAELSYKNRRLEVRIQRDAAGKELYRETYFYDSRNRLRSVRRLTGAKQLRVSSYSYDADRLAALIIRDGDNQEIQIMDRFGRVVGAETYTANQLSGLVWFEFSDDHAKKPSRQIRVDDPARQVIVQTFDAAGRPIMLSQFFNDQPDMTVWQKYNKTQREEALAALGLDHKTDYQYNEAGQVIGRVEWQNGQTERWEFVWDGERQIRERYFMEATLVQVTDFDGDLAVTTAYQNGRPAARVFKRSGQLIKSQQLAGDQVLEERLYE